MDASTYTFESTAQMRLTKLLGIPGVTTPIVALAGPTTVSRAASTAPAPGRFRAETRLTAMNLRGTVLGVTITATLNDDYQSTGAIEGRADPKSPDPNKPEPIGSLKSTFKVWVKIVTPLGTLINKDSVDVEAQIKTIPPAYARYLQHSPPRNLYEKKMDLLIAELVHATHIVKFDDPLPRPPVRKGG